jgi:hypothetical protein
MEQAYCSINRSGKAGGRERASTDIISVGICRGAYSIGETTQRSGGYTYRRRTKRPVTNTQRCIAFGYKRRGQQKARKKKREELAVFICMPVCVPFPSNDQGTVTLKR